MGTGVEVQWAHTGTIVPVLLLLSHLLNDLRMAILPQIPQPFLTVAATKGREETSSHDIAVWMGPFCVQLILEQWGS